MKTKQYIMISLLFFREDCDTMFMREDICCANEAPLVGAKKLIRRCM